MEIGIYFYFLFIKYFSDDIGSDSGLILPKGANHKEKSLLRIFC